MLLVYLLYVLVCACAVWLWRSYTRELRAHALPPAYPGALPIIGHANLLLGDTEYLWKLMQLGANDSLRQGGVTVGFMGRSIYYLITDPDDALTASNSCLQKHFAYNFAKPWLGDGLGTGSGEVWKRHRKLMNPAFSLPVINGFLGVFNSHSRRLLGKIEPNVGKGPFDCYIYFRKISLETFCLSAFGVAEVSEKIVEKYMEAVDEILHLTTKRFYNIYLHTDFMWKLSGYEKQMSKPINVLNKMYNEIVERKEAAMKIERDVISTSDINNSGRYIPLLDLLLSMKDTLTDQEIREEINTTIFAGFDTTSLAILIISILLGSHPDVQERLYEELIAVLGPDRNVEKDDLNKLVYTEAVIKEALRYYSGGPALLRYVEKDVKLKNYTMRAGSQCVLMQGGTHRHAMWGPDSHQFRPERWLDAATMPDNPNAFGAFSWGKRNCIGKTYAIAVLKVTIAHFIRRYRVKADASKLKLKIDFILKPVSGQEISVERRT